MNTDKTPAERAADTIADFLAFDWESRMPPEVEAKIATIIQKTIDDATAKVGDLAMLVRRLSHQLPTIHPIRVQALAYLRRKGLQGSPHDKGTKDPNTYERKRHDNQDQGN